MELPFEIELGASGSMDCRGGVIRVVAVALERMAAVVAMSKKTVACEAKTCDLRRRGQSISERRGVRTVWTRTVAVMQLRGSTTTVKSEGGDEGVA